MRSFVILLTLVVCLLAQQGANGTPIAANDVANQQVDLDDGKQQSAEVEDTYEPTVSDDESEDGSSDESDDEFGRDCLGNLKAAFENVTLPKELLNFVSSVKNEFGDQESGYFLVKPEVRANFSEHHEFPQQACKRYETEVLYVFEKVRTECDQPPSEVYEAGIDESPVGNKLAVWEICYFFSEDTTDCQQCSQCQDCHYCDRCKIHHDHDHEHNHNHNHNHDDEHVPATQQVDSITAEGAKPKEVEASEPAE